MHNLCLNCVKIFFAILFLATPGILNAQTVRSANIQYFYYMGDSVKITVSFSAPTNTYSLLPITITPENSKPFTVNLKYESGGNYGGTISNYQFTANVNLKNYTDCKYTFGWKAKGRDINGKGLYIEATLDKCLFKSNYSRFSPAPPNVFNTSHCIGKCNTFSMGTDHMGSLRYNDSISYTLVNARLDYDSVYNYASGYDSSKPMSVVSNGTCSGFNLNPLTGLITYTPNKQERAVVAVKTMLWSKDTNGIYKVASSVMSDVEIFSYGCSNLDVPRISGINGTSATTIDACFGENVCFTVNAYDDDSTYGGYVQHYYISNFHLLDASLTTRKVNNYTEGKLCFKTQQVFSPARQLPYFFTMVAADDNYPAIRSQKTFAIQVHDVPRAIAGRDTVICAKQEKIKLQGMLYSYANGKYTSDGRWSMADASAKGLIITSSESYFDPLLSGIGNFKLVYSYNDLTHGCFNSDTVLIKVLPVAKVNGGNYAAQCIEVNEVRLNGSHKDGIWGTNSTGLISKDSSGAYYFSPNKAGAGKHKLWYTASIQDSCTEIDTVIINVLPYADVYPGKYDIQCIETTDLALGNSHKNGIWNTASSGLITKDNAGNYHFSPNKAGVGIHKIWYTVPSTNDSCGGTDTIFIQVDSTCVWPGDANLDKTVDYLDILDIALGYSSTGSPRINASTDWFPQASKNWSQTLSSGLNYKHLDTNGDSVIDANDTFAVSKNYGKTHLKNEEPQLAGNPNDPPLSFQYDKKYYLAGDTVKAVLYLGDPNKPVSDAYGLGLKYLFANPYMQPNSFKFNWNCDLLCGAGDNLQLYRQFNDKATAEGAIARTDKQTSKIGYGKVAEIEFILKDSTFNYPSTGANISLEILNSKVIKMNGEEIPMFTSNEAVKVYRTQKDVVGVKEVSAQKAKINIYPNPANNMVTVDASGQKINDIAIINVLGEVVANVKANGSAKAEINVAHLPAGVYFVRIASGNQLYQQKLIINR